MPKYTNTTSADIALGSTRIPAGESVTMPEYIQSLPAGITEDTSVGYIDPIIYSAKHTTGATITVPATSSGYDIRLYVNSAGEGTVKFNSSSATAFYIGGGESVKYHFSTRLVDSIIVTISGGTIYVTIEKS